MNCEHDRQHNLTKNASDAQGKEEAGCATAGCVYEHGDYDIGTTYYAIDDQKELLFVLEGLTCKLCEIHFGRQEGEWKPGQKTPVYACQGMCCGHQTCEWAVCGRCFGKEQLTRADGHATMRTKRAFEREIVW